MTDRLAIAIAQIDPTVGDVAGNVAALKRAHGGDIVLVESTARGTTFRLTLPRTPTIGRRDAEPKIPTHEGIPGE